MTKHRETGCLVERSAGHWAIVISTRDPATGKRKRQWHSFTGTKKEAQAERIRLLAAEQNGTAIDPRKMKLAKYLEDWLRTIKESVSPRTYERYAEIVAKYLVPALGEMILSKLDKFVIGDAYVRIRTSRTKGEGELSARTVLHCHRVLSAALRQAVPRHLPYNPAADAKRPKVETRKATTYSLTQSVDVLEALRGAWMHVPALDCRPPLVRGGSRSGAARRRPKRRADQGRRPLQGTQVRTGSNHRPFAGRRCRAPGAPGAASRRSASAGGAR